MERLQNAHFTPIDIPLISAIIAPIVKGYFCYRIWTLNKRSSKVCIVIALFTILQSAGSIWGAIAPLAAGGKFAGVSPASLYLWAVSSAVSDILTAIAMVMLLARARCEGGRFSNFVMVRLVRLAIETNAITATVAVASFVLYMAFPHDTYFVFTCGLMGKIYSNTLFVSLNNRIYFRDHSQGTAGIHIVREHVIESDPSHRSLHFTSAGSTVHETTLGSDSYALKTISHTIDLSKEKGDAVSINSDPIHPKSGS